MQFKSETISQLLQNLNLHCAVRLRSNKQTSLFTKDNSYHKIPVRYHYRLSILNFDNEPALFLILLVFFGALFKEINFVDMKVFGSLTNLFFSETVCVVCVFGGVFKCNASYCFQKNKELMNDLVANYKLKNGEQYWFLKNIQKMKNILAIVVKILLFYYYVLFQITWNIGIIKTVKVNNSLVTLLIT